MYIDVGTPEHEMRYNKPHLTHTHTLAEQKVIIES